ncbi:MAG: beta-ketoacyl-ACP synthase III [Cytophagales bacterium]|nr:ketoacyl-ACP synthase III [Bernardetiaceae bacterium]MDW8210826.1 beta-ketoacyl-ACP synthase III [Cytophagales bacterium]
MTLIRASITGIGGYVPEKILTNKDLEAMVDTSDEWIVTRTGIRQRHILENGKGASFMALKAIERLMEMHPTNPAEIDAIICCTTTPDYVFPATANLIGTAIGANNAFGFDLQAACSGFLYGLVVGAQMIESGRYKKVLLVGTDKMSAIVDYKDRSTCIIFGDGAGAVFLEPDTSGNGFIDAYLRSDGKGAPFLHMKAGGSLRPASFATVANREHFIYQEGSTVFKHAVTKMAEAVEIVMKNNHLSAEDIAFLVPHQANKRIIDATAERAGLPPEKVMLNIQRYGNTTNATLPLCLWDYRHALKKGDNLILAAFGGGFTWGAAYLKWAISL